jgi:mannan endo-1,4-beta-mannosidase
VQPVHAPRGHGHCGQPAHRQCVADQQAVQRVRAAAPRAGKFLGIQASGAPNSLTPLENFAANLGRKPNLVGQYVPWGQTFDAPAAQNAWSYGALYYMAWEPFGISAQAIVTGHADGYITQFARAVRTLNLPVALSFGHEMNGNWYPWGTAHTTAVQFVAAWTR